MGTMLVRIGLLVSNLAFLSKAAQQRLPTTTSARSSLNTQ